MNARDELTAKVMSWMQLTRDMPQQNLPEAAKLAKHFEVELKRLAKPNG